MTARSFCTITASTKRPEDLGSNRKGDAIAHLASLAVTPLWPVDREIVQLLNLPRPVEYKECFHVPTAAGSLPDVAEGDILTHESVDYRITYAGEWPDGDVPSLRIVVQQVKGS